jgi:hypothetical protein
VNWTRKSRENAVVDVPVDDTRSLGLIPMVIEQSGRGERAYDI